MVASGTRRQVGQDSQIRGTGVSGRFWNEGWGNRQQSTLVLENTHKFMAKGVAASMIGCKPG
jgi:hypothetical protein